MATRSKWEMTRMWADIVLDRWKARMEAYNVGQTGELLKSLQAQVAVDSNGDPSKVTFLYLYYGRFPDMGVGGDITLSDVPDPSGHRHVKPWYSKVFIKEVATLGRMMAAKYGFDAAEAINAFRDTMLNKNGLNTRRNDDAWFNMQNG